jgi:hypothetical protein
MKQNSARVVDPTRRDFVKYGEKYSAEISCDEFLEVPESQKAKFSAYKSSPLVTILLTEPQRAVLHQVTACCSAAGL